MAKWLALSNYRFTWRIHRDPLKDDPCVAIEDEMMFRFVKDLFSLHWPYCLPPCRCTWTRRQDLQSWWPGNHKEKSMTSKWPQHETSTLLLARTKDGSIGSTSSSASSRRYIGLLISTFSWLCIRTCINGLPRRRLRMIVTAATAAAIKTTKMTKTTTTAVTVLTFELGAGGGTLVSTSLPRVWQRTP